MIQFDDDKQNKQVASLYKEQEENLAKTLSKKNAIGYVNLATIEINSDALRLVPEEVAREAKLAAFDAVGKQLKVAVLAPTNPKTMAVLDDLKSNGYFPTLYMASTQSLDKAWGFYKDLSYTLKTKAGALTIANDEIATFLKQLHTIEDVKKILSDVMAEKNRRISSLLETILAGALALNASDVHVEPEENTIRIRYRLDGVLIDVIEFDRHTFNLLISRLKLLSGMRLNLKGAQDGRFSIVLEDKEIEVRASILPSAYDESVVLRVLNPDSIAVPLESLGISGGLLKILEREIAKPEGMILTTGPTGSGKTTALYAFLKKIYNPELKIITIENPIEYHLPGIVQTQTDSNKGYTFLEGLRSALRQDPDIIMIGEIRDSETAATAVNAALTGHLVFSTLHTNDAAGTFPRLIDLGVNPKVITSAVSVAMAQRLVRKLCPTCRKEVPLEEHDRSVVKKILDSITSEEDKVSAVPQKTFISQGCKECNFTGYKGRIGIYEAILPSEKIEAAVNMNPSEREIWVAAEDQGILNMKQDGVLKVLKGITSLTELRRVITID
jgi:type IV pilus assembly protein PilB